MIITAFVALLRAVNVGGTGKLAMADLRQICEAAGLLDVQTYIASGNLVFRTELTESQLRNMLEQRLRVHTGQKIGVLIRTAAEVSDVLRHNPFSDAPGNRVVAIFLDQPPTATTLASVTGQAAHEHIRLGRREIYVHYGEGQAQTKLRIPAASDGTARNMNTVAKLVALSNG